MFENLIESKRKADKKKAFGLGFVSLVGHSVLVLLAVIATLTAGQAATDAPLDTTMVFLNQEEKKAPEEQPPVVDIPQLKGFQTVVAPTDIPTNIPPINLQEHFDPKDYSGTGVEGGIGTGIVPSSGDVYMESVVEERPEVLPGGDSGTGAGAGDHRHGRPGGAALGQGDPESEPRLRPVRQELCAACPVPSGAGARARGARPHQPADRFQDQAVVRPKRVVRTRGAKVR